MNIIAPTSDIARYLPVSLEEKAWGVGVRGIGRITNAPRTPYPPAGHPVDHAFDWRHGRVLGAWQLVLVVAGGGECEFGRDGGVRRVEAGSVIIIVPGQWHRYRPAARTGWRELWIEFDGETPRRLTEAGLFAARGEVRSLTAPEAAAEAWSVLLRSLDEGRPAEQAAAMLQLLGQVIARDHAGESPMARAIRRATHILTERLHAPPTMPELAREVGVGYAVFRREFRKRTGLSPRRHLLHLRLERTRRLIGTTPLRLEAVAEAVGFSSAFHLSAAFKARYGVAPAVWRRGGFQLQRLA
ncbi:MAG: AraC family transcriptional regulator [Verrucomicrobiota bacterium]